MSHPISHSKRHRELAHRVCDGFDVMLLWNPADDSLTVKVFSHDDAETYELAVPRDHALNAFHHPFVYAALKDLGAQRMAAGEVAQPAA
jgi:hypothetical protein